MRGVVKLAAAVVIAATAAGCGQQQPVSMTDDNVLDKAGLKSYWQLDLELQDGERIERLYLLDEMLYCLTDTEYMLAVDAARGVRLWSRKVARPGQEIFPPCHGNGVPMSPNTPDVRKITAPPAPEALPTHDVVIVNTPAYAMVLDRDTGRTLRHIDFQRPPDSLTANTGGACDSKWFYVGAVSGRCYAFRLNTNVISWILRTQDILSAAPETHSPGGSPRVFVAGEDGEFYVLKAGPVFSQVWPPEGIPEWPALAGPVTTGFHVDDRGAFIPCVNRRVYRFSLTGGEPTWWFTCKGALKDPVQVSENTVFQYAEDDTFYAIDPANGKQRWHMPEARVVVASIRDGDVPLAYIVDDAHNLLVVDEILGTVRASVPLTGVDIVAKNTAAPAIYVAGSKGRLQCIRPAGSGRLTEKMLREASK